MDKLSLEGEQTVDQVQIVKKPFYKRTYFPLLGLLVVILAMCIYIFLVPSVRHLTYPSSLLSFSQSTQPAHVNKPAPILPRPRSIITQAVIVHTNTGPTLIPTPTLNPGISWEKYTNQQYGYTILFPPNWTFEDLGALEPEIPSYIVFNPDSASSSARSITISVSTRTYQEQLAIGGSQGTPVTAGSINGTEQFLQDSEGNQSATVILPLTASLLVLDSIGNEETILNIMLSTLHFTE